MVESKTMNLSKEVFVMKRKQAAEKRVAILKMYLEGSSRQKIVDELKIDYGTVGRTIAQFRKNPEAGATVNEGNKAYSYELKKQAVDMHLYEGIPLSEVASKLGLVSFSSVKTWCWIAKKNGGILPAPKGKGRKSIESPTHLLNIDDTIPKDDQIVQLKRRNAYLEMENELLKKLRQELRR
jgi:transposase